LVVYTFLSLPVIITSCKYFTPTLILPLEGGGEKRWIPDCSGMTEKNHPHLSPPPSRGRKEKEKV
jgi:hypothetical protein